MKKRELFKRLLLIIGMNGLILLFGGATECEIWAQQKTIVVNSAGGNVNESLKKAFMDDFEKETGIKVILTSPLNFGKLRAMVETKSVEWDLCEVPPDQLVRAVKLGLLEKIDYSNIKTDKLYPGAVQEYAIGYAYYSTIIAYNTNKIPKGKHPKSWADFWDVKTFPGIRAMKNSPVDSLEIASMADGVSLDKVYPIDFKRAFKKLDEIKPHIKVWWKIGAQPAQLLTDGEIDLACAFSARISDIIKKGASVNMEWNQGIMRLSFWGIPKGAKNYKESLKLIDFMMQTKYQLAWDRAIDYPGPNKEAYELMDAKELEYLPTSPNNIKKQVLQNAQWWLENADKAEEMWGAWILK